jgi:hypothetical protein
MDVLHLFGQSFLVLVLIVIADVGDALIIDFIFVEGPEGAGEKGEGEDNDQRDIERRGGEGHPLRFLHAVKAPEESAKGL